MLYSHPFFTAELSLSGVVLHFSVEILYLWAFTIQIPKQEHWLVRQRFGYSGRQWPQKGINGAVPSGVSQIEFPPK
jgi:hypothetical protein